MDGGENGCRNDATKEKDVKGEREAVMDAKIEAADSIRMEKKKDKNLDAINKETGGQLYCPETTKKEETRYYPAE